jgi:hypothetical protein
MLSDPTPHRRVHKKSAVSEAAAGAPLSKYMLNKLALQHQKEHQQQQASASSVGTKRGRGDAAAASAHPAASQLTVTDLYVPRLKRAKVIVPEGRTSDSWGGYTALYPRTNLPFLTMHPTCRPRGVLRRGVAADRPGHGAGERAPGRGQLRGLPARAAPQAGGRAQSVSACCSFIRKGRRAILHMLACGDEAIYSQYDSNTHVYSCLSTGTSSARVKFHKLPRSNCAEATEDNMKLRSWY